MILMYIPFWREPAKSLASFRKAPWGSIQSVAYFFDPILPPPDIVRIYKLLYIKKIAVLNVV